MSLANIAARVSLGVRISGKQMIPSAQDFNNWILNAHQASCGGFPKCGSYDWSANTHDQQYANNLQGIRGGWGSWIMPRDSAVGSGADESL